MPTPTDLRQALGRLEAQAPDAARTRAVVLRRTEPETPSLRRTHRTGALLIAAVAVLVALATVVVLTVRGADLGEPVRQPAFPLIWTFDLPDPPGGTAFERLSISADEQVGMLTGMPEATVMITVHAPGVFDPAIEMSQRVAVDGREGYFGTVGSPPTISLVWPTPEGGWAQLEGSDDLAVMLPVARLVQFGRFGSPALPFRLGWLPDGLSLHELTIDPMFGGAFFSDGTPGVNTLSVSRIQYGSFATAVRALTAPDRTELTVDGRPAVLGRQDENPVTRVLVVDVDDDSVLVVRVASPAIDRYPDDVMRRIAEQADVSMSMTDQSTWIPAPEAIGG